MTLEEAQKLALIRVNSRIAMKRFVAQLNEAFPQFVWHANDEHRYTPDWVSVDERSPTFRCDSCGHVHHGATVRDDGTIYCPKCYALAKEPIPA